MKIFGHPIHVMLIHFPSALLPMDLICSILGYSMNDLSFVKAAFYASAGGVVLGWLAIITGAFDLAKLTEERNNLVRKALTHAGINLVVIIGFSLIAFTTWKQYPALEPDSIGKMILKAGLIAFMIIGNFIGGSLVLKHGVGAIDIKPKA
jgi:uncharacterized membrane protein